MRWRRVHAAWKCRWRRSSEACIWLQEARLPHQYRRPALPALSPLQQPPVHSRSHQPRGSRCHNRHRSSCHSPRARCQLCSCSHRSFLPCHCRQGFQQQQNHRHTSSSPQRPMEQPCSNTPWRWTMSRCWRLHSQPMSASSSGLRVFRSCGSPLPVLRGGLSMRASRASPLLLLVPPTLPPRLRLVRLPTPQRPVHVMPHMVIASSTIQVLIGTGMPMPTIATTVYARAIVMKNWSIKDESVQGGTLTSRSRQPRRSRRHDCHRLFCCHGHRLPCQCPPQRQHQQRYGALSAVSVCRLVTDAAAAREVGLAAAAVWNLMVGAMGSIVRGAHRGCGSEPVNVPYSKSLHISFYFIE